MPIFSSMQIKECECSTPSSIPEWFNTRVYTVNCSGGGKVYYRPIWEWKFYWGQWQWMFTGWRVLGGQCNNGSTPPFPELSGRPDFLLFTDCNCENQKCAWDVEFVQNSQGQWESNNNFVLVSGC